MLALVCLLAIAAPLAGQVAERANEGYRSAESRASVNRRLISPDRDAKQRPAEVVALLGLKPGMTVADVGTGPGYLVPHLSAAVGPSGRVIAEDIFPDTLKAARERVENQKLGNVTFVQGTDRDARLPAGGVDVAVVLDVYHHFDYPGEMLASIAGSLKPGGRLVVIDYHKRPDAMDGRAPEHVRLADADAIREIESHGFQLVSRGELPSNVQWVATFRKK